MPYIAEVRVRPLAEEDLDEADRICRMAFGTFLGMPEPEKCFGDAGYVRTRWKATRAPPWPRNSMAAWQDRTSPPTGGASASSAR